MFHCFCLTRFSGELQAAGAELRLGDCLQESGVLSCGEIGWQLADIARHEVGLLVPDQEGDIRLQHINAYVLLRVRQVTGGETNRSVDIDIRNLPLESKVLIYLTFSAKPRERKNSRT